MAGVVDWRLSGFVSRSVAAGKITGSPGETVLLSPERPSLPPRKLLVVGMGDLKSLSPERMIDTGGIVVRAMRAAGCREIAASIPGIGRCGYSTSDLAEWFISGMLSALWATGEPMERWPSVHIIETPADLSEVEDGLRVLKTRLREKQEGNRETVGVSLYGME